MLLFLFVISELHCSYSQWSAESGLFGDKRLAKYLDNIEKRYRAVLDQVTTHGGTECLHKNLARLESLVHLAQQQKDLKQVHMQPNLIKNMMYR